MTQVETLRKGDFIIERLLDINPDDGMARRVQTISAARNKLYRTARKAGVDITTSVDPMLTYVAGYPKWRPAL